MSQGRGRTPWKPFKKECCTDGLWLFVFLLFCFGMVGITAFAFSRGSFSRLMLGYDSFGNMCGQNNSPIAGIPLSGRDQTENKYVFTLDPWNFNIVHRRNKSLTLCVSKCPDVQLTTYESLKNFSKYSGSSLCSYDLSPDQYTTSPDIGTKCPQLPVNKSTSWSWLFNHCAPMQVYGTNVLKSLLSDSKDSSFQGLIDEFVTSIEIIVNLFLLALVLSYVLVILFRYLNKCIWNFIIILLIIGLLGGTACLWWLYGVRRNALDVTPNITIEPEKQIHDLLIYAITATVFTVIMGILMCFVFCNRVPEENTFRIFALAGEVFMKMWWLPFLFLWTILFMCFIAVWTAAMLFFSTVGNPVKNSQTGFVEFHMPAWVKILMFCHTIGLIWFINFMLACQQMIVAKAVATYYFRDRERMAKNCWICPAFCHVLCYHLGTAAIGALVIPLAKIPSLILLYIRKHLKQTNCCSCIVKICICSPLYLNLNAYTATVINSTNLFESGLDAFRTLENAQGMASVEHITDVVVLLGKKLVVFCTTFVGVSVMIIQHSHVMALSISIISCLFACLVVHSILSIFVIVIDVILLCYAYDLNYMEEGNYYGDENLIDGMKSIKYELINLGREDHTTERS